MKVGKNWGVDIYIDFSCLLGLIVFFLFFYPFFAKYSPSLAFGATVLSAVLVYIFCLIHELAHVWMALRNGVGVSMIALHFLGGVTVMTSEMPNPWTAFKIFIAGPAASLVIAGFFWILVKILLGLGSSLILGAVLALAYVINLMFAIFNLLPINGLDGGGAFIYVPLWAIKKDRNKASMLAARISQVLLVPLTVYAFLSGNFLLGVIFILLLLMNEAEFKATKAKSLGQEE